MSSKNRVGMKFGSSLPKTNINSMGEQILELYKNALYQIKTLEIALEDAENVNVILSGDIERLNLEKDPNKTAENIEIYRLKNIIKALTKVKK